MVRVRKEVWRPGRYVLADGREWTDSPDDIRNGHRQGSDMLAAGLNLPLCWEHQSQAMPTYLSDLDWSDKGKAEFARSVFGKVAGFELEDGAGQDPTLFALLDIPSDADAEQFKKTGYVSPRLDTDYRDSKGRTWPGKIIAHVAATPVPVQVGQAPAELSKALGTSKETVYLSQLKPKGAGALNGRSVDLGKVAELLKKAGLDVGQPRNEGEFMAALEAAVNTKFGADDMGNPANANDPNTDYANSPPALMSKLPQPVQDGLKANLTAERNRWVERIDKLFGTGRVNGPIHRELKAQATAAELSYGDGWKVAPAPWMARVEAYEALPEKTFHDAGQGGTGADLSRAGVVERPDSPSPGADDEAARSAREKAAGDAIMAGFVGFEKK